MNYEIAEIQQDPARIAATLKVPQVGTLFSQRLVDLITKGLYLALCLTATYDKVIGKTSHPSDIEHHYVISLFIRGNLYRLASLL